MYKYGVIIFALIALLGLSGEPTEITQEQSADSLMGFEWEDYWTLKPLDSADFAVLDSARWAYYRAVKDSFPTLGYSWWANSVRCWYMTQQDSLKEIGKYPWTYSHHLDMLMWDLFFTLIDWADLHDSQQISSRQYRRIEQAYRDSIAAASFWW